MGFLYSTFKFSVTFLFFILCLPIIKYNVFSPTLHQMLSCTVNDIVGYIKSHKIKFIIN